MPHSFNHRSAPVAPDDGDPFLTRDLETKAWTAAVSAATRSVADDAMAPIGTARWFELVQRRLAASSAGTGAGAGAASEGEEEARDPTASVEEGSDERETPSEIGAKVEADPPTRSNPAPPDDEQWREKEVEEEEAKEEEAKEEEAKEEEAKEEEASSYPLLTDLGIPLGRSQREDRIRGALLWELSTWNEDRNAERQPGKGGLSEMIHPSGKRDVAARLPILRWNEMKQRVEANRRTARYADEYENEETELSTTGGESLMSDLMLGLALGLENGRARRKKSGAGGGQRMGVEERSKLEREGVSLLCKYLSEHHHDTYQRAVEHGSEESSLDTVKAANNMSTRVTSGERIFPVSPVQKAEDYVSCYPWSELWNAAVVDDMDDDNNLPPWRDLNVVSRGFSFLAVGCESRSIPMSLQREGGDVTTVHCNADENPDVVVRLENYCRGVNADSIPEILDRDFDLLWFAPERKGRGVAQSVIPEGDRHRANDTRAMEREISDVVRVCEYYQRRNPDAVICVENPDEVLPWNHVSESFHRVLGLEMVELSYCLFQPTDAAAAAGELVAPRKDTNLWTNSRRLIDMFKDGLFLCQKSSTEMKSYCGRRHIEGTTVQSSHADQCYPEDLCKLWAKILAAEVTAIKRSS